MKIDTGIKLKDVEQLAQAIEADAGQAIDGLREALTEGASGDFSEHQIITPEQMLIKQARSKLKLNQKDFAHAIKTPLGTLRDWEQGRSKPNGATTLLLEIVNRHPETLLDLGKTREVY